MDENLLQWLLRRGLSPVPALQNATRRLATSIDQQPTPAQPDFEPPRSLGDVLNMGRGMGEFLLNVPKAALWDLPRAAEGARQSFMEQPAATMRGLAAGAVEQVGKLTPADLIPGAASRAIPAYRRVVNTESRLTPIAADKYGLSNAPTDRRNFFYRATPAPRKAAEARVSMAPGIVENATKNISRLDKGNLPGRAKQLKKVRDEAKLVDAIQDKYGLLNENIAGTADPYQALNPMRRDLEWVDFSGEDPLQGLLKNVHSSTARKLEKEAGSVSLVRPGVVKKVTSKGREVIDSLESNFRKTEKTKDDYLVRTRRVTDRILDREARKRGYEDKEDLWVRGRVSQESMKDMWAVMQSPKYKKAADTIRKRMEEYWDKVEKQRNKIIEAKERYSTSESIKGDPVKYIETVLQHHTEGMKSAAEAGVWRDQAVRQTRRKNWWKNSRKEVLEELANKQLRDRVARLGGPIGKIAREAVEAKISGNQMVRKIQDDALSAVLQKFGISSDMRSAVEGMTGAARNLADQLDPTTAVNNIVKDVFKRFGIKPPK